MSSVAILHRVEKQDIRFLLDGDRLIVNAPVGTLTAQMRDYLRQHKPDIVKALHAQHAANLAEAFEERAAIMEFEGGLSRVEAEGEAHQIVYGNSGCQV